MTMRTDTYRGGWGNQATINGWAAQTSTGAGAYTDWRLGSSKDYDSSSAARPARTTR